MSLTFAQRRALAAQQAAASEQAPSTTDSGESASASGSNTGSLSSSVRSEEAAPASRSSFKDRIAAANVEHSTGVASKSVLPSPILEQIPMETTSVAKAEEAPLGKVIQSFNAATTVEVKKEIDELSGQQAPEIVAQLQQRIHNMQLLEDGTELKHEMTLLSDMITKNGEACRYLLNEDLGMMVRQLRRMTGNRVARDMAAAGVKGRKKATTDPMATLNMTPQKMAEALTQLSDDDWNL